MRKDIIGLFFDDTDRLNSKGKLERFRERPKIPNTGWTTPKDFPNLFNEKIIGLDVETFDPELKTHGPGWARGVGHLVGISLSTKIQSWYFPIRHETEPEHNLEPDRVLAYLKDLLAKPMAKVGANIVYDLGWLKQENIKVNGLTYDIQYAEALLDDVASSYSLESIAQKYLKEGKVSNVLYEWLAEWFGGSPDGRQRANIYKSPPRLCGPYAEADASLPLKILDIQYPKLKEAGLWDLFTMECELIPVLMGMRFRGLPVNINKAAEVEKQLEKEIYTQKGLLDDIAGFDLNVNATSDLVKLYDKLGIKYPYTAKGNPSFNKQFLATDENKVSKTIVEIRKLEKINTTFIKGAILDKNIKGKIYPNFHPLRGEAGGAVSGRYSSSNPNAQNIPSRDKILAPLVRGIFCPEQGFDKWIKLDLSQIEYRMFAHYSNDKELISEYQNPDTDYHDIVSGFLLHALTRKLVKNFNFMSLYGGGRDKTIDMIKEDMTQDDLLKAAVKFNLNDSKKNTLELVADHFINLYAEKFPAAKRVLNEMSDEAMKTGEIRTILNRRNTFNMWEQKGFGKYPALPFEAAMSKYGTNIKRAKTYIALNRKLQGSAADLLKKGMLDAYKAGLFKSDKLGFPHVTVHDELDFSFHDDLRKEALELVSTVEQAIKLKVPVIMDIETGTNWGNVDEIDWR